MTFHEKNKKLHALGKTLTAGSASVVAPLTGRGFLFYGRDLSVFSATPPSMLRDGVGRIRPDKFIFDHMYDASILDSIRGTLFLIWNIKDARPVVKNA
ncbi:hypothetical protein LGM65_24605 [Burkholderia anthina]|uniref:hypothetical protein n=1 Tax=Burkholderia anthina TaxID=179879 RepID=UPI001CF1C756|nr:hypothetical protein [Burkholderia anthina]MCA8094022.1 hypothetical protein [Burkholderia anthina]